MPISGHEPNQETLRGILDESAFTIAKRAESPPLTTTARQCVEADLDEIFGVRPLYDVFLEPVQRVMGPEAARLAVVTELEIIENETLSA